MTPKNPSMLRPAAAAALALSLVLPLLAAAPLTAQAQGRIAGKVMDQDGEPLADVEITLFSTEIGIEIKSETNKKGRFTISVVDSTKPYRIRLEKEGFLTIEEPADPPIGDVARKEWQMVPEGAAGAAAAQQGQVPQEVEGKRAAVRAYNEAADAYNAGDLDAAVAKFEEAVAADPDMIPAKDILGSLYLERDRYADALALADEILVLEAANVNGLSMKYDALVGLGRRDEGEAVLDALFAAKPDEQTAVRLFNAGVASLERDDSEQAEKRFSQAVEADPTLVQGHGALAQLEIRRALEHHQEAISTEDEAQKAALVQQARELYEKALARAETILALDPTNVRGLEVRYDALSNLNREEEAQEAYAALQSASPESIVRTFFEHGRQQFDSGQTAGAIESLEKVVAAQPDHEEAHYFLGLAYASSGDESTAREHLERFVELAPDHPEAETARQMLPYLE